MAVVAASGDAPAANDEEDELFGDLTADDHADQHERGVNPQQAAGAPHHAVAIAPAAAGGGEGGDSDGGSGGGGGGLAGHETRANEAAFRNMGYLEAYDATKEERLQEGFEAGYREAVDVATSIGLRLGRLVGRTAAGAVATTASTGSQGKRSGDTGGDDDDDRRVEKEAAAAAARLAAKTVRTFLDGQLTQPSDAVSPDEALQQVRDLEKEVNEQFCDGQGEATCTGTTALRNT